jgi:hypothetical protein
MYKENEINNQVKETKWLSFEFNEPTTPTP